MMDTEEEIEIIGPQSLKQEMFLASDADITVYGGGAGGGKSFMGIMDHLQYVEYHLYRGVLVRKSVPQLTGPGGLWDEAMQIYTQVYPDVKPMKQARKFVFPSGAEVFFRHCESDDDVRTNFHGWQIHLATLDEGQQFSEYQASYIESRLRSGKSSDIKPKLKITCNPEYDSYLRSWVEWYLDPDTGIPDPKKDGIKRYFITINGVKKWANSPQQILSEYGNSYKDKIKSFVFISATVYDNPSLMKNNPEYVRNLENLGRVERERLLLGSWYAREEKAGYFKREWVKPVELKEIHANRVRSWDLAFTLPTDEGVSKNPDYTVGVLMSKNTSNMYTVEDVRRTRVRAAGVEELILRTAYEDGQDVTITIPSDFGGGKAYALQLIAKLAERGFTAKMKQMSGHSSKLRRFSPFSAAAEAGYVQYVKAEWNKEYFDELEAFDGGNRKIKDDQVDATSDAFNTLASGTVLPSFSLPSFSHNNPYKQLQRH